MKVGIIYPIDDLDFDRGFERVREMGINTIQVNCWTKKYMTDEVADMILAAAKKYDIEFNSFWCGWEGGPRIWNFYDGPLTLGLVPRDYRMYRTNMLIEGSAFAKKLGITDIATHVGFLPENPGTTEYNELVAVIKYIAGVYKENGQNFLFETGQETPITLLRIIEDVNTGNLGINFDPANLLLYGKANPVDALDIIGKYVRNIHGKDGEYPTNGRELGEEKPLGEGRVNYPALIAKLKEIGYDGPITIERENSKDYVRDIIATRERLEKFIGLR